MKNLFYILSVAAIMMIAQENIAQRMNDKKNEIKLDKSFQVSGKSRTVKMKKGDSYTITLDLKKDRGYYISVSGDKRLSDIQYKLVSANEKGNVLYDNSAFEFRNHTVFSVMEDSKVVLEVKTQPANYFSYSSVMKDVKLLIASRKMKSSQLENMSNVFVLASNN